NGLEVCTCKRTQCERHGKCAQCIEHHNKKLPACMRAGKPKRERTRKSE
ncbi:MAG: hypothetical protein GYA50_04185, partial [Eubacteriaceae bacterium]|nr:hypothetical protein [Eubacteriaceae bacterium]